MAASIEWPDLVRGSGEGQRPASPLRDERTAAILGIALGVSFTVCFATGLFSHWAQSLDPIVAFPARPAGLYRVTQGLHVFTGVLSIPLLLAKLWTVLPKFFRLPPVASLPHLIERIALLPLVGGAIFLLFTGFNNIVAWYPWEFGFVAAHYWAAWITIGGLVAHVGAKVATTRRVLRRDGDPAEPRADGGLGRRGFLAVVGGLSVFLASSVGAQTIAPFRRLGLFSPRDLSKGPQGFPVNSSARRRGVTDAAQSPDYRLRVTGAVARELAFTLDDLRSLELHEAELPIACVEGWSKSARWRGVRLRDLLAMAGAADGSSCTVVSLQERGGFRSSFVNANHAGDGDTLLALEINGEELHIDHGYPVRLIGPNRPGVNQTKWVTEVRVS
ncbi:molybdopterin-dependent oxidoreductase [Actinospongicola halichondriae]|uniref:molybdopterin-dependent oxidoreductase n=1 Tax=Actinospongicola halichondriae TaxID=3236844 RepID=UPI003D383C87